MVRPNNVLLHTAFLSCGSATFVQILEANAKDFLNKMNAEDLAGSLIGLNCLSHAAHRDIQRARSPADANSRLLLYMKQDADKETVLKIFNTAAEQNDHANMKSFATEMLQKLQRGLY